MGKLEFLDEKKGNLYPWKAGIGLPSRKTVSLLLEKKQQWFEEQPVLIAFNLPRISARLERLMGTNVVRLTDRRYMNILRTKIQEDHMRTLQKRIEAREEKEEDRRLRMILKRSYTADNCPPDLVVAHSIALAEEMENVQKLMTRERGSKLPTELANHPVFIVNQRTNEIIQRRRSKLKTTREKNAERLLRQGANWERERLAYQKIEQRKEKERAIAVRLKHEKIEKFQAEDSKAGLNLLRISDASLDDCEVELQNFIEKQTYNMRKRFRMKGIKHISDPKDMYNIVASRRRRKSVESVQIDRHEVRDIRPHSAHYSVQDFLDKTSGEKGSSKVQSNRGGIDWNESNDEEKSQATEFEKEVNIVFPVDSTVVEEVSITDSEHNKMLQEDMEKDAKDGLLLSKAEYGLLRYEDPNIKKSLSKLVMYTNCMS